ncbi:MAG TPA: type II toxin-antitoxin system RelE/ParE family toxin [Thermoanaerobaculia bacterium]|nr:type II toxin-antitoxin system RelE/ParE family toxin [Thermoanaerobaculia bacterium]
MTKPLLLEPEASRELEDAARWYEERRSGLGQRFLDAVASTLDRIVLYPAAGAPVPYVAIELAVRQAPVNRFPYHVVYLEMPEELRILAVAHDRRRPGYWLERHDT